MRKDLKTIPAIFPIITEYPVCMECKAVYEVTKKVGQAFSDGKQLM